MLGHTQKSFSLPSSKSTVLYHPLLQRMEPAGMSSQRNVSIFGEGIVLISFVVPDIHLCKVVLV